jgi:adenylate cyclase
MSETRKLAAILAADIVGYSRLAGADEDRILARLRTLRSDLIDPTIAVHHGRVVKRTGDGAIVEFRSAVDAVRCAIEVQNGMMERNEGVAPERRIVFRIGIHVGDVVEERDGDLMGDGVNVAARLEGIALPGGIYLSRSAFEHVQEKIEAKFVDLGEKNLKNIARPINVYALDVQVRKFTGADTLMLARSSSGKPSIAVLPFQNMSSDPEQEHFADGLSEDIITALSRIHSLFVIARNSTFTYKGRAVSIKQVGQELGAQYIVEGSVRKSANRIRVTGQLIDAESDKHIWADKYDRALDDIFQIQDDIARAVVASVELQIGLYEGEIVSRDRLDVWSLLKRSFSNTYKFTIPSMEEAATLAEQAVQLDENSALAYGQLSASLHNLALMRPGATAHQEQVRARELAVTAVKLDPTNEFCQWQLGCVCAWFAETDTAIAAFRRAIEINPNYALAWGTLGSVLAIDGKAQEAIAASEICIQSNPRDPSNFFRFTSLAEAHYLLRNFETSLEWARKSVDRQRNWFRGHHWVIASLMHLGRSDEARGAVDAYLREFPQGSMADAEGYPQRNATYREDLLASLRAAGMPERAQ